jgi:aminoglycoside phosphotransferase (APT) family kinase protein
VPADPSVPDAALAASLAAGVAGQSPVSVTRFPTGSHHYVFEACFADRAPLVVRLTTAANRPAMAGAARLSKQLRPLGVPLPALLAEDVAAPLPYLVLERLPGTDLAHVVAGLAAPQLDAIAAAVARAQLLAGQTPSAGRYGHAVDPAEAPRLRWSDVVRDHVARSRDRTLGAGLFDLAPVEAMAGLIAAQAVALDAQPAVPFLHDTTTKNVIVAADGSFSGIVDVDDLCFGDPRYPAALTLASLLVLDGPQAYVAAWLHHAGLADDGLFRLYVASFLLDFMAEHGHVFNGNPRPSTPESRARLLQLFGESFRRASEG